MLYQKQQLFLESTRRRFDVDYNVSLDANNAVTPLKRRRVFTGLSYKHSLCGFLLGGFTIYHGGQNYIILYISVARHSVGASLVRPKVWH